MEWLEKGFLTNAIIQITKLLEYILFWDIKSLCIVYWEVGTLSEMKCFFIRRKGVFKDFHLIIV